MTSHLTIGSTATIVYPVASPAAPFRHESHGSHAKILDPNTGTIMLAALPLRHQQGQVGSWATAHGVKRFGWNVAGHVLEFVKHTTVEKIFANGKNKSSTVVSKTDTTQ